MAYVLVQLCDEGCPADDRCAWSGLQDGDSLSEGACNKGGDHGKRLHDVRAVGKVSWL